MDTNKFDAAAVTWDDNPGRMAVTKAVAKAIGESVPLTAAMTMLDFGCGTAALSVLLADRVAHVEAVDTSSGMIAEAHRKLEKSPELAGMIRPAVLPLPIEEHLRGTWDVICSSMVMHHIEDAEGTLRHLVHCLRPGGYLALADLYSEDGSFHGEEKAAHNGFEPQALARVLAQAGLTQMDTKTALTFPKPGADGQTREYSVFLLTGRRAA